MFIAIFNTHHTLWALPPPPLVEELLLSPPDVSSEVPSIWLKTLFLRSISASKVDWVKLREACPEAEPERSPESS
jgi:hypothetical protein